MYIAGRIHRGEEALKEERASSTRERGERCHVMRRSLFVLVVAVALVVGAQSRPASATGNGAPSGPHYNLNLIGVAKDKTAVMTGGDGHVIFVRLWGNTKILLTAGDFMVLDANGTDGSAAFRLPDPDPLNLNNGTFSYSVWVRALGKPGGRATGSTCFTDLLTGEFLCSMQTVTLKRTSGQSKFTDVSKELLSVCTAVDLTGTCTSRVSLFDSSGKDFLWSYDNQGLKLAQLRFYPNR